MYLKEFIKVWEFLDQLSDW